MIWIHHLLQLWAVGLNETHYAKIMNLKEVCPHCVYMSALMRCGNPPLWARSEISGSALRVFAKSRRRSQKLISFPIGGGLSGQFQEFST